MKVSNQVLHELGMIDDITEEDSTFGRMLDDFEVVRTKKHKNKRKYSEGKTQMYRARRLAKKLEKNVEQMRKKQLTCLTINCNTFNKKNDNGEPLA